MRLYSVWKEMEPFERRRAILRLVTSLLQLILGPSLAWKAGESNQIGGFISLGIYILVHLFSRFLIAGISSRGKTAATRAYKLSPSLLSLAAILCLLNEMGTIHEQYHVYIAMIAVPILLGSYEGGYWCSYHSIARYIKDNGGKKSDHADDFQRLEVLATFCSAILIFLLSQFIEYFNQYFAIPSVEILASCFALILASTATVMPSREINEKTRADHSPKSEEKKFAIFTFNVPLPETKNDWSQGKLIAGNVGIIQVSIQNAMRMISLPAGGIELLSLFVAFAGVAGRFAEQQIEKKYPQGQNESAAVWTFRKALPIWPISHKYVIAGILIMATSLFISEPKSPDSLGKEALILFIIGWLIAQASIMGSIRKSELFLATKFLKEQPLPPRNGKQIDHEGNLIGIRERMKFEVQIQFAIATLIAYPLYQFIGINQYKWVAFILLFWSLILCITNLRFTHFIQQRYQKICNSSN